jgi:hypothetical protein
MEVVQPSVLPANKYGITKLSNVTLSESSTLLWHHKLLVCGGAEILLFQQLAQDSTRLKLLFILGPT